MRTLIRFFWGYAPHLALLAVLAAVLFKNGHYFSLVWPILGVAACVRRFKIGLWLERRLQHFMEVRERNGLKYSVHHWSASGRELTVLSTPRANRPR